VSRALQDALRATDRIGRMGGDEFAIVLPEVRSEDCVYLAQRVRQISPIVIDLIPGTGMRVGFSLGLAIAEPEESFEAVLARADSAMYDDKRRQKLASESLS
jgi:diguanylate cyclase (GGDEF)-like protein